MQLGMFRHPRLDEQGRFARIDAHRQPIDDDVKNRLANDRGILVRRRQGVPIGDKEKTLEFVLQLHPVFQHSVIVPKV